MAGATLKAVAKLAGVAPTTVSRVVNGSENVATATRERILEIIKDLDYAPNIHAAHLRRKRKTSEAAGAARYQVSNDDEHLSAGSSPSLKIRQLPETKSDFKSEERALARLVIQLCRDLDALKRDAELIQSCVNIIREACSRLEC